MPSLKDLRLRIESVKNTRKITKAMQMVAAAKLRKAQESAVNARPYAEGINGVVNALTASLEGSDNAPPLLKGTGSDQVQLLVAMSAERGLCGSFNSAIVKLVRIRARELIGRGKTVKIMTVGKKGREQLRREFEDSLIAHVDLSHVRTVGYGEAQAIAGEITGRFDAGEFDVATIFFSTFRSVIVQEPTALQLIPAMTSPPEDTARGAEKGSSFYEFEPGEEEILDGLLPRALTARVFAALLENAASEQGSRMTAMDSATRNAGDMIDRLTIEFNRSRQAAITKELIEIISGAEAL
ncbi:MAG: F0F1 ATP synthase subunit gamma [Paracoccaceae bacterium]|nr:F0F1 ATP synthase subunit gamma [Paracoccaceae bacterium]MDE2914312.1 F0F1 ATP synthase subunit gamma [Paracoccaceae bacterium]